MIEECKKKEGGWVERTKKIWVLNKKKDGVESNEQKQKMGFEQKKDGFWMNGRLGIDRRM